ncbi:hypothetical protein GCM10027405_05460 [Arthrobacter alkaliphilus]|uniref:hypothetical protein n=1 Tax=Arthrobacter alkaliphilus TaxID=369936 RepID=UPI001F3C6EEB|nr:hypothetical protein [Arthrobacter alkaliphilus]
MTAIAECEPSASTPDGGTEAIRNAIQAIIDADLTLTETRAAIWSLIPKEHHHDKHRR